MLIAFFQKQSSEPIGEYEFEIASLPGDCIRISPSHPRIGQNAELDEQLEVCESMGVDWLIYGDTRKHGMSTKVLEVQEVEGLYTHSSFNINASLEGSALWGAVSATPLDNDLILLWGDVDERTFIKYTDWLEHDYDADVLDILRGAGAVVVADL